MKGRRDIFNLVGQRQLLRLWSTIEERKSGNGHGRELTETIETIDEHNYHLTMKNIQSEDRKGMC